MPWLHVLLAVGGVALAFGLLADPARIAEAHLAALTLRTIDPRGVPRTYRADILLAPGGRAPFWVQVTPACSSLAPILGLSALATFLPSPGKLANASPGRLAKPRRRVSRRSRYGGASRRTRGGWWRGRLVAAAAASSAVFLGNQLRIDASAVSGLVAGRLTLVLFHNWVGSAFGFAYLLGGYVLMLWLLLPAERSSPMPAGDPLWSTEPVDARFEDGVAGATVLPVPRASSPFRGSRR